MAPAPYYQEENNMVKSCYSIPGYAHLYRSLLRFYDMPSAEAKELLYTLNTANLDSFAYTYPHIRVMESGPVEFCRALDGGRLPDRYRRPYRTEVQFYKALCALHRNIDPRLIISAQREARQNLRCIISNVAYRFYKAYGVEIDDKRTVYADCAFGLVPREDEPSVCMMRDWLNLQTA